MNISLENYRAIIGNLNAGQAVIYNGQLKKVNNGWFARHFDCFKTTASNAQNQDVTLGLYRALKQAVANDGRSDAAKSEYLQKVREELGLVEEGDDVVCTGNRPLERRTIKRVVQSFDNFRDDCGLFDSFERDLTSRIEKCMRKCRCAYTGIEDAVAFFQNHEMVKIGEETIINPKTYAIVRKGDGPLEGRIVKTFRKGDGTNVGEVLRQFNEGVAQVQNYSRLMALKRTSTTGLGDTLDAMNELDAQLEGAGFGIRGAMEMAKKRLESLKTDGILREKFIQYLELYLTDKAEKFGMYDFRAEISKTDMERIVARFETRMILEASFTSYFEGESKMEQVNDLAKWCVEAMDKDYFRAAYGAGD